jgi:spermidine synthase
MSGDAQHAHSDVMAVRAALIFCGFTSTVAQVVLLRELLVAFYGNELSIGIVLFCWLLLTAVGSAALGRLGKRIPGRILTASLLVAGSLAFLASIFLVSDCRSWWNAAPGEAMTPLQLIFSALLILSVFCPISGWLFAAGARACADSSYAAGAESGSMMYRMEAAGAALGGIVASVVFFRFFGSLQIAAIVAAANIVVAARILIGSIRARRLLQAMALILALCGILWLPRLQRHLVQRTWPGFQVLSLTNSRYGSLAVVESEGNRSVVQNGLVLFTVPDQSAAEEAVHFPLLVHPDPRSVLLIGGGLNGSIAEILRHPSIVRVDYVELDPAVLGLGRQYAASAWSAIASDPRVHVHAVDGRLFVKESDQRFDVIIVNLPEPQTAQLNRFFTEEFFVEAARRLSSDGILALHLHGAEEYISPGLAEFLGSVAMTLRRVFPEVVAIPGEEVHLLATPRIGGLRADADVILRRLRERDIQTAYVRDYYLNERLASDRVADLNGQLAGANRRVNRDLAPTAYYFNIALWGAQFSNTYRDLFRRAAEFPFPRVLLAVLAVVLVPMLLATTRERTAQRRRAVGFAVTTTGISLMCAEIIILLGFEAIYGYVFDEISLIVAGFMAGMAVGSGFAMHCVADNVDLLRRLALTQFAAALLPLALVGMLAAVDILHAGTLTALLVHLAFPAVAIACGLLGGYQFPLALRLADGDAAAAPGLLYGLDLLGAAGGAIALSSYLLPVFGFLRGALLVALPGLGAFLMIGANLASALAYRRRQAQ